jgi:hypothetical protein
MFPRKGYCRGDDLEPIPVDGRAGGRRCLGRLPFNGASSMPEGSTVRCRDLIPFKVDAYESIAGLLSMSMDSSEQLSDPFGTARCTRRYGPSAGPCGEDGKNPNPSMDSGSRGKRDKVERLSIDLIGPGWIPELALGRGMNEDIVIQSAQIGEDEFDAALQ